MRTLFGLVLLAAARAWAEGEASAGGPAMGYIYDEAHGLHPVLGIPGAATTGPAMRATAGYKAFAPAAHYAIAVRDGSAVVLKFDGAEPLPLRLAADMVAVAPSGGVAAFYDRAAARIRVIDGLPGSPAVRGEIDVSGREGLRLLAVADEGKAVLASFTDAAVVFDTSGAARGSLDGVNAAAFLPASADLVVAAGESMYLARESGEMVQLAFPGDALAAPAAVGVSSDGRRAFAADANGVLAVDLVTGERKRTACPCTPARMDRLAGKAVFRIAGGPHEPVWVFDGDAEGDRVVFVPAYTPERESRHGRPGGGVR